MIRAYALHTEMKRTGYFSCENPLVQKLYENQVWGQKLTMWKCRPTARSGMSAWAIPGTVRCLH